MKLINKWDIMKGTRWGINYLKDNSSIIEIVIKIPLPYFKIERWISFECLSLFWGKKTLFFNLYFRIRRKQIQDWKPKWYERVIIRVGIFWYQKWYKTIYTRRQIDDAFNKSLGREWYKNKLFVDYLVKGGTINA